jgi:4'-phosphopantetheinyl transferase
MSGAVTTSIVSWPVADVSARLATHDAVICVGALLATEEELSRAVQVLAPQERARFESYTNDVVARRYAMGRALLREIVGCAIGAAPKELPIREGVHGKPALGREASVRPLWFSVAHCEDLVAVALSRTSDVGIDLERARAIEQWERVADRVLAASELTQLRIAVERGEDAGSAFLRQWCRVEAELKAIGCGIVGLDDHRAGKRPLGLRVMDLPALPVPAMLGAGGARFQGALALCAPGLDSARQIALDAAQAARPTATPARASTA